MPYNESFMNRPTDAQLSDYTAQLSKGIPDTFTDARKSMPWIDAVTYDDARSRFAHKQPTADTARQFLYEQISGR